MTFQEQLQVWLAEKERSRAAKTVSGYRYTVKHYLTPELKALKLQAIRPSDLRTYYATVEGRFKPNTIKQIKAVIHGCLEEALRQELIARNPASIAKPKIERGKDHAHDEEAFEAFSPEEATAFLTACRMHRWGLVFEFMLATGVRRGEACGLLWSAVDLGNRAVRIERSVTPVDGKATVTATKNKGSRRTLYISAECANLLERTRAQQVLERAAHSDWQDSGYVFSGVHGGMLHPDTLTRHMAALCKAAGVPRLHVHGLRHTYASLALRAGVPIDVVSKQLGHASMTMTLDIYRTVYRQELQAHALDLSQLLRSEPPKIQVDMKLSREAEKTDRAS